MMFIYRRLMRLRPAFIASFMKKILRIRRRMARTDAGSFYIDPVSNFGYAILTNGEYEPRQTDAVNRLLEKGDVFVDIGANEGYFSVLAGARVGENGKVICVEPQSRLQTVILKNLAANGIGNASVFQLAISDSNGLAELSLPPDINTGHSALFRKTRYRNPTETVPVRTLAGFLDLLKLDRIKLLKMDIEGFEYEAIFGSKDMFRCGIIENIMLELHPSLLRRRGKEEKDILDFLGECGYERDAQYKCMVLSRRIGS